MKLLLKMLVVLVLYPTWPLLTMAMDHSAEKPNIIYILADVAGYADFGCFGQKDIKDSCWNFFCERQRSASSCLRKTVPNGLGFLRFVGHI